MFVKTSRSGGVLSLAQPAEIKITMDSANKSQKSFVAEKDFARRFLIFCCNPDNPKVVICLI